MPAHAFSSRIVVIDPGLEIFGFHIGKLQQQIGDVPFRIDHDRRNMVQRSLFKKSDAESGFSTSCHADAECMRCQIARVVMNRLFKALSGFGVIFSPEVK